MYSICVFVVFFLLLLHSFFSFFFFFNDTATTEIYTLSLHDALPILWSRCFSSDASFSPRIEVGNKFLRGHFAERSEEHTSELQSLAYLVCRLLLEKKKKIKEICINHKIQKHEHKSTCRRKWLTNK